MSNLLRGPRGILVVLALVGVIAIAGVATAFAAGSDGDRDADHGREAAAASENDGGHEAAFKGSVAAPAEKNEGSETAEASQLQKLAKINKSTADKAALNAVPGSVKNTKLDDENSYVVYEVQVVDKDGQTHHVDVDAGNGKVLHEQVGADNDSDKGGGEAGE